jgi:hypothetical protein
MGRTRLHWREDGDLMDLDLELVMDRLVQDDQALGALRLGTTDGQPYRSIM